MTAPFPGPELDLKRKRNGEKATDSPVSVLEGSHQLGVPGESVASLPGTTGSLAMGFRTRECCSPDGEGPVHKLSYLQGSKLWWVVHRDASESSNIYLSVLPACSAPLERLNLQMLW